MNTDLIRWAVRRIPIRHLSDYLVNRYRKNVTSAWQWVDCSIADLSFRLKVNAEEVHGYLCYMYGVIEPEMSFFIQYLLPSKQFFLDIGANVGYYSVLAAMVNPDCQIYSFEPSPSTFDALCQNIAENRLLNTHAYQLALGDKTGALKFNIYADQAFNSPNAGDADQHYFFKDGPSQVIDVPSVKLDDFLADRQLPQPDIIKLDVEGFEYFVLQGARKLLDSDNPPILLCELQLLWLKRFGLVKADLIDYVEQFGYLTFGLTSYGLVRKDELDRRHTDDIIFVPKSKLLEIMQINDRYYSGWRKVKGEVKKFLLSIWRSKKA